MHVDALIEEDKRMTNIYILNVIQVTNGLSITEEMTSHLVRSENHALEALGKLFSD